MWHKYFVYLYLSIFAVPRLNCLYGWEGVLSERDGQTSLSYQLANELHNSRLTEGTTQQREDLSSRVDSDKSLSNKIIIIE